MCTRALGAGRFGDIIYERTLYIPSDADADSFVCYTRGIRIQSPSVTGWLLLDQACLHMYSQWHIVSDTDTLSSFDVHDTRTLPSALKHHNIRWFDGPLDLHILLSCEKSDSAWGCIVIDWLADIQTCKSHDHI